MHINLSKRLRIGCVVYRELLFNNKSESFIITSKRVRTTIMKHIDKLKSMQIVTYLSCAIHNYIHANQPIIKEVLGDNTYEYNECYECKWKGEDYFYYCTSYGLNKPICSICVNTSEEYEEYECNKCQSCEYFGSGYFYYYSNTALNTPICIDCKLKNDKQIKIPLNDYEDGWKKGWKAAMKHIKKFTTQQMLAENIHIPKCISCGEMHNLKKCSGSCKSNVLYCSRICQKKDWYDKHKNECSKQ